MYTYVLAVRGGLQMMDRMRAVGGYIKLLMDALTCDRYLSGTI